MQITGKRGSRACAGFKGSAELEQSAYDAQARAGSVVTASRTRVIAFYYMTSSVSGQDETKSRAVIGYPSGKAGAILPARDFSLGPARSKIIFWCFKSYNKAFIDQNCSVKMAGYWPRSVFCVFMDLDFVHKHAKKRTWPLSSHLDLTLGQ